jgi:Rod binding domain-containing protein
VLRDFFLDLGFMTGVGYCFFTGLGHCAEKSMQLEQSEMDVHLPPVATVAASDAKLRQAAQELEVSFLAEMLKSAGLGAGRSEFGGGAGEDQFSSFLVQEQARQMVAAGGIGLSETLFHALRARA